MFLLLDIQLHDDMNMTYLLIESKSIILEWHIYYASGYIRPKKGGGELRYTLSISTMLCYYGFWVE